MYLQNIILILFSYGWQIFYDWSCPFISNGKKTISCDAKKMQAYTLSMIHYPLQKVKSLNHIVQNTLYILSVILHPAKPSFVVQSWRPSKTA